jgi:type II secretory pathway pseudopilin PulG
VVVAIIGVLATVVLASLSSARAKAKATRAIQDMSEIKKAIILTAISENLNSLPTETELGLGGNPTIDLIVGKTSGVFSTFSDFYPSVGTRNPFSNTLYSYDNDNDENINCQNWAAGAGVVLRGLTLAQKELIDLTFDKTISSSCGSATYDGVSGTTNLDLLFRIATQSSNF